MAGARLVAKVRGSLRLHLGFHEHFAQVAVAGATLAVGPQGLSRHQVLA
jgi:hypothetical protein